MISTTICTAQHRSAPVLRGRRLALVALLGGLALPANAAAQNVDTSEWLCEFCPFEEGARTDVSIGATSVSDTTAYLGSATGLDDDGVYADVNGEGSFAAGEYRLRWAAVDLGLDSRAAWLEGGRPGSYGFRLGYSELPQRRFVTTSTIFAEESVNSLALPASWVRGATTAALPALGSSLVERDIASDRRVFDVGGSVDALDNFSVSADYRRQEHEGLKIHGGSSFTNASLLPMPFDYQTDEVELALRYATGRGQLTLGWYLSDFGNSGNGLAWDNPFTTVTGAGISELARAPDSRFQQLRLAGSVAYPERNVWISASAATGRIEQDEAFLSYTTNPNIVTASLPATNLAGEVDTSNFAVSLTSKPLEKARIRFSYRYDERDNTTPRAAYSRVIVDSLASGASETNVPYSFERSTLKLEGDYDLFSSLRLSAGYERRDLDRDFQEVAEQNEDTGWGRVRWRPLESIEIDARGGTSRREIDRYDEALAASFGQNPLLRKYNLAFRYREFGELTLNFSPAELPLSIGLSGLLTDDSYTQSELGIVAGEEWAIAADIGWTIASNASLYLTASFDDIESIQLGSQTFSTADWRAEHEDSFRSLGGGLRLRSILEDVDVEFDYMRSNGKTEITIAPFDDFRSKFPNLATTLEYLRMAADWRRSTALTITADLRWQRFETDDWALQSVGPATIPTVLSLGARPYDEDAVVATLGFRYRFGAKADTP